MNRPAIVKGLAVFAAALITALPLAGCTGDGTPRQGTGTAVPAPSGGNVKETVTPAPTPEAIKTRLESPASPAEGLTVRLGGVKAIEAKAQGPGEVAGPAVAVTIEIENKGSKAFDTGLLSVNLDDAKGRPGSGMMAKPAKWITGSVEPDAKVSGVYVFTVPKANRDPITVSVSLNPGMPTVLFTGRA